MNSPSNEPNTQLKTSSSDPFTSLSESQQSLRNSALLDAFVAKYQISELGSSQVALTLPEGTTRIEFLKEAQSLSIALHVSNPEKYKADQAVWPDTLKNWQSDRDFSGAIEKALSLRVDGNVKGSTKLTRLEQEDKGWNDLALQDLAVAHTAFFLLSGKDLFEENGVRAAGGGLLFDIDGLKVYNYYDGYRDCYLSASRSLPVPN